MEAVNALVSGGYAPLAAMILASRGVTSVENAGKYLDCNAHLCDPFLMRDMIPAVERIRLALSRGEKIAVFGDYDVDGITATCLLTEFLRSQGGDCVSYIPGRLEEGYGLNPIAISQLHAQGVKLIVTVDCGITAVKEALLCGELGIELVITDHHVCKDTLPQAAAVVDPHRKDCGYPHKDLSGVGVAFKLAAALCGDQAAVLRDYADMVCLGTVADVMPLRGENRVFVARGLEALRDSHRPGLLALMKLAGCERENLTASSVGYSLAPRINAAGRMGKIDLAVDLMLTRDPQKGEELAEALCDLNRQRQAVETGIYQQAMRMLPPGQKPDAIVLADPTWHQGVVGIVASRIAEEFCCPTFLICLDGDHGKASSRSYGGFNLFQALSRLSPLLESYGGHELAAGFTISKDNIDVFREEICQLARGFYAGRMPRTELDIDCGIGPELLTFSNVSKLSLLEPCGTGCPKPVLMMQELTVDWIGQVGGGRHMRLRLSAGRHMLSAIWFSASAVSASIAVGDVVDVAFMPQINEFRGERTVQMNVLDIRPSCRAECPMDIKDYCALCEQTLDRQGACRLLPEREMLAVVWRYLVGQSCPEVKESPECLCRKIVRWSGKAMSLGQMLTCLDIFADVGLLKMERAHKYMTIVPVSANGKADLQQSRTMQRLVAVKESK